MATLIIFTIPTEPEYYGVDEEDEAQAVADDLEKLTLEFAPRAFPGYEIEVRRVPDTVGYGNRTRVLPDEEEELDTLTDEDAVGFQEQVWEVYLHHGCDLQDTRRVLAKQFVG